jgi:hypothetical protein
MEAVLRDRDGAERVVSVSDDLPAGVNVPFFSHVAPCDGQWCDKPMCRGHMQFGQISYFLTGAKDAQGRPIYGDAQ